MCYPELTLGILLAEDRAAKTAAKKGGINIQSPGEIRWAQFVI